MKGRPLTDVEYQEMLLTGTAMENGDSIADFMRGLWLSGLRRGEAMKLSWDRDESFSVDMSGEYLRFRIRTGGQKSKRAQLAPITPDFSEFLLARQNRKGLVFHPLGLKGERLQPDGVGQGGVTDWRGGWNYH